ncbi:hypothetical protein [Sphingobacterium sp.]|uniref:hypothetical protein n=1 Tax=Sphingobacterium sp. TaxID=341027 RepID=UPI002FDE5511
MGSLINEKPDKGSLTTATWMGRLDPKLLLNGIIMPGSHDAGMSQTDHCGAGADLNKGIVQTQALDMLGQLAAGARYFDIRVDYDHGKLVSYHRTGNAGCNGQPLADMLEQAIAFIDSHQSETCILKFSHIRTNRNNEREIKDRIDQFLANIQYRKYFYNNKYYDVNLAQISLEACRGKIILVFDYPEHISARSGRFRYCDKNKRIDPAHEQISPCDPNISVYDSYANTASLEKMKQDQLAKLIAYGGLNRDYFFLLSWTLTPDSSTFLTSSIKNLAKEANEALEELSEGYFRENHIPKPNIAYMDYVNEQTARSIIALNFF